MSNYKCPHCKKIAWKEPCNHCGKREGPMSECEECGAQCCKFISIPLDMVKWVYDLPWLKMRGQLIGETWRVESHCRHLTDENKCAIYRTRPKSCKDFEVDGEACRRAQELVNLHKVANLQETITEPEGNGHG